MFISPAFAQDAVAATAGSGSMLANLAPLLFIFVIFYFLVIRPQSKKIRAHQEMLGQLKKGDKVITGAGFLATVISVNDNHVTVDLGNGIEVQALKHTLSGLQNDLITPVKK
jgi:preprotein translocase subunit YajC